MAGTSVALALPQAPPDRLAAIRGQISETEKALFDHQNGATEASRNVKRIQTLIKLRKQERELGRKRLSELESTVHELESRREVLHGKVSTQKASVRKFLAALDASEREAATAAIPSSVAGLSHLGESEKLEAPRRKLLANLSDRGLREIEILKVDLADADRLEERISEEKQQWTFLFQDLDEKESVLELNRQIQVELAQHHKAERLTQLENYRKLKTSESEVENLIQDFNARRELERATETEHRVAREMSRGVFAQLKGKLTLPVAGGRVISSFGRVFDPKSQLYVFKKGVDVEGGKKTPVRAVSSGKLAYSGTLPNYGQVAIIDHGDHFYSLCAQLGSLTKKTGDLVAAGEPIGITDDSGTPIYFEIRARNVAVNPLQWVSNSSSLRE